jgi:hypothetical protein
MVTGEKRFLYRQFHYRLEWPVLLRALELGPDSNNHTYD